jgi:hypothetical protein
MSINGEKDGKRQRYAETREKETDQDVDGEESRQEG